MTGDRYRLITQTFTDHGVDEQVGTLVISRDEANEHISSQALLHRMGGWQVRVLLGQYAICMKNEYVRVISARRYTAMDDNNGE